ncbi:hypothetical protein PENSPDRAFT_652161 [Peniophora sp. CONT]|nr:hypothetical protein PENSPDRAFT_652161 [Peniophora sp. CONT]
MQIGVPTDGLAIPDRARNERWKFLPHDGDGYTSEDKTRCFEQQPILVNGKPDDLPLYLSVLLGGCADLDILPPILHFGWRLDGPKLMAIVRNHFPNCIDFAAGTPIQLTQFIDDEDGKQEAQIDWDMPSKMGECAMTTIFSSHLTNAVQERLQIPAEDRPYSTSWFLPMRGDTRVLDSEWARM